MTEEERAEWLARAVDALIRGESAPPPPPGLRDDELEALLRVARLRLEAGRAAGQAGLAYEGEIWEQLLARFEGKVGKRHPEPHTTPPALHSEGEDDESDLKDVITLRWRLAEELAGYAERHREDVWRDVQSRIQAHNPKSGIFSIFDRAGKDALRLAAATAAGGEHAQSLEELLEATAARKHTASVSPGAPATESALWERVEQGIVQRPLDAQLLEDGRGHWAGLAALGAAAALVIAALGPVPATGFADSPAANAVDFVATHLGLTETDAAPAIAPVGQAVQGSQTTLSEARQLTGLPVVEPPALPPGFRAAASRFFPVALTAEQGGMFVLTYDDGDGAALAIYQESASGAALASFRGSAIDVMLAGSIPATYFDGAWHSADGLLHWSEDRAQSVLFDQAGMRTIIQYTGSRLDPVLLVNIAQDLLAAQTAAH